ncbi:MAG: leucyl aminopeptidase, partial [Gemmobacter sp.]|nr:leucyl aminopeptidase [Gemmobacter sp.]
MTPLVPIEFRDTDLDALATAPGRIVVFAGAEGTMGPAAKRMNRLTRGGVQRFVDSPAFAKLKTGEGVDLAWPAGLEAEAVQVIKLDRRSGAAEARKAGATIGAKLGEGGAIILADTINRAADVSLGLCLRAYTFSDHKSEPAKPFGRVTMMVSAPEAIAAEAAPMAALAEGVFFTRDLVSEPANVLTTDDFAARLAAMQELGLEVEILEEADLEKLGMRTLLAVGMGSDSPSKVVVMQW